MDTKHLKELLDACFTAKHVIETLPELPEGMKPRHIHVLDQIKIICDERGECQVSDVSTGLNITMPSITRLIQELENMHLVRKYPHSKDKRVTLLQLTSPGLSCVRKYVYDFQNQWAQNLEHISDEEAEHAVHLIEQLELTMPGRQSGAPQK